MSRPRLKPILLPAEHGGWSLIGAPLLAGWAVAPSTPGGWVAGAALALFLARQPLKIAGKDVVQGKRFPRTRWALGFGFALLAVAAGALVVGVALADARLWGALGLLAVLSGIQFAHDVLGRGRSAVPEIAGACAAASFASIIALAGGKHAFQAWLLGAVLAMHAILAIVYVSARLALARGGAPSPAPVWGTALGGIALAAAMLERGWVRWPLVAAFAILAVRALWGVSPWRARVRPQIVGFQETAYAVGWVLLLAFGAGVVGLGTY